MDPAAPPSGSDQRTGRQQRRASIISACASSTRTGRAGFVGCEHRTGAEVRATQTGLGRTAAQWWRALRGLVVGDDRPVQRPTGACQQQGCAMTTSTVEIPWLVDVDQLAAWPNVSAVHLRRLVDTGRVPFIDRSSRDDASDEREPGRIPGREIPVPGARRARGGNQRGKSFATVPTWCGTRQPTLTSEAGQTSGRASC